MPKMWLVKGTFSARHEYEAIAQVAGNFLRAGTGDGLKIWLNALRTRGVNVSWNRATEVNEDGTETGVLFCFIHQLCRTSAHFCCELQCQSLSEYKQIPDDQPSTPQRLKSTITSEKTA